MTYFIFSVFVQLTTFLFFFFTYLSKFLPFDKNLPLRAITPISHIHKTIRLICRYRFVLKKSLPITILIEFAKWVNIIKGEKDIYAIWQICGHFPDDHLIDVQFYLSSIFLAKNQTLLKVKICYMYMASTGDFESNHIVGSQWLNKNDTNAHLLYVYKHPA